MALEELHSKNESNGKQYYSQILNKDITAEKVNEIINLYNKGIIQYIICYDDSPAHLLYEIDPEKLQVIINWSLQYSSGFLKRCCLFRCTGTHQKIHYISLIQSENTPVYEGVERICGVTLTDLPANVGAVLI